MAPDAGGAPAPTPSQPPRGPHDEGTRESRFHTRRGHMGLRGWLRYPAIRWHHRHKTPDRPWLVPAAVGWLRRRIRSDWTVLELGSGRSTAWLARRCGRLISFEDNTDWHELVVQKIAGEGLDNAELRLLAIEQFVPAISELPDASLDMVLLDFLEAPTVTRNDAVEVLRAKVRPGGLLVLDDSDRPGYARSYELLAGWRERRFSGLKDDWHEACETTVFRRPGARRACLSLRMPASVAKKLRPR